MAWTYQGNAGQPNRCEDLDALRDAVRIGRLTRDTILYDTASGETLAAGAHPALDQWFYQRDGLQQGPFPAATLRRMAANGRLLPEDTVTDLFNLQPRPAFNDFAFPEKTGLLQRLGQALRNRNRGHREIAMALVGTQGCGKTVFATVLANRLSRTDAAPDPGYHVTLAPADNNTMHFQGKNWDLLQSEQWPPATQPGKFKRLQWHAELADGRRFRLAVQDMAGHDLRAIFSSCAGIADDGGSSSSSSSSSRRLDQVSLSPEAQTAIDFCSQADIVLFLLNLDDFYDLAADRPAPLRYHNEIILAEMFRQLRRQGRRCCLLLTQVDRHEVRMPWPDIGRRAFPFLWQQFIATGDVPFCPLAAVATVNPATTTAPGAPAAATPAPGFHSTGLVDFSAWLAKTAADLLDGHATTRQDDLAPGFPGLGPRTARLAKKLQRWRRRQPRAFLAAACLGLAALLLAASTAWWRFAIDHEARTMAKIMAVNTRTETVRSSRQAVLEQMLRDLVGHIQSLDQDAAAIRTQVRFQHKKDFIGPFDLEVTNPTDIHIRGLEFTLHYPQHQKAITLAADIPANSTTTLTDAIPRALLDADFTAEIITCGAMAKAAEARDILAHFGQERLPESALKFDFIQKHQNDLQLLDDDLANLQQRKMQLEDQLARVRSGRLWPWQ